MSTLTPSQREAYDSFKDLWERFGFPRNRAHQVFKEVLGYREIPYFMELDVAECERIKKSLRPDYLLDLLSHVGQDSGICEVCGRELTDPESKAAGIGPVCGGRLRNPPRRKSEALTDLLL